MIGRWIGLIHRVATGSWKTRVVLAPIAGALYFSFIAVFILLSFVTDHYLHLPKAIYQPWSVIIGVCVITLGFFTMLISVIYFIKAKGTPVPFSPPPKLVTTGPYGFARNPMLSGIFIQLFGLGIVSGSLSLIFFFTPLFIIINVWELKKVEEPELLKRLGQEYAEYKRRAPMFFPFHVKR